jgi:regulatory protein
MCPVTTWAPTIRIHPSALISEGDISSSFESGPRPPKAARKKPAAVDAAASALGRRQRTISELRLILKQKRYPPSEIDTAVEKLTDMGYLDDPGLALHYAAEVARARGWGPLRVKQELAKRGLGQDIIDVALERAAEQGMAPSDNIRAELAKLLRIHGDPVDFKQRRKIQATLARRGFLYSDIEAALGHSDNLDENEQVEES